LIVLYVSVYCIVMFTAFVANKLNHYTSSERKNTALIYYIPNTLRLYLHSITSPQT